MGLMDRDYMRRPGDGARLPGKLAMIAAILAVGSAAIWFYRDARTLLPSSPPAEGSLFVNINGATLRELESLPGIGPARAQLIIQHRPYQSADDLKKIRGIPDGVIDDLKPLLRVSGETVTVE
jgi:competence ComEA-like helix-hairpin-helix protein